VIWAAIAIRRIAMARKHDLDLHLSGTLNDCVEVIDLKPKQNAVPIRFRMRIADPTMVMFDFETVKLQDQIAIGDQLFISAAPVITATAKQTLIPLTTRFYIRHCYQGLRAHLVHSIVFT
jgi:hypothetical protein